MAEIVNLRLRRKHLKRKQKEKTAEQNRLRCGISTKARDSARDTNRRLDARLDGHLRMREYSDDDAQ